VWLEIGQEPTLTVLLADMAARVTGRPPARFGSVSAAALDRLAFWMVFTDHEDELRRWPRGRARLHAAVAFVIRLHQRLAHRQAGAPAAVAAGALERLGSFDLSLAATGAAFAWALINWAADGACLAAAIAAIGVTVPFGQMPSLFGTVRVGEFARVVSPGHSLRAARLCRIPAPLAGTRPARPGHCR
jgi:hypothetical protein